MAPYEFEIGLGEGIVSPFTTEEIADSFADLYRGERFYDALVFLSERNVNAIQHPELIQMKLCALWILGHIPYTFELAVRLIELYEEINTPIELETSTIFFLSYGYCHISNMYVKAYQWAKEGKSKCIDDSYLQVLQQFVELETLSYSKLSIEERVEIGEGPPQVPIVNQAHDPIVVQAPIEADVDPVVNQGEGENNAIVAPYEFETGLGEGIVSTFSAEELVGPFSDLCTEGKFVDALAYLSNHNVNAIQHPGLIQSKLRALWDLGHINYTCELAVRLIEFYEGRGIPILVETSTCLYLSHGYYHRSNMYVEAYKWAMEGKSKCIDSNLPVPEQLLELERLIYPHLSIEQLCAFVEGPPPVPIVNQADNPIVGQVDVDPVVNQGEGENIQGEDNLGEGENVAIGVQGQDNQGVDIPALGHVTQRSCSFDFQVIKNLIPDLVFEVEVRNRRKLMIKLNEYQGLENLQECRDGETYNPHILKVDWPIDEEYCICEEAKPLFSFFREKMAEFRDKMNPEAPDNKKRWWKFIQNTFTQIFGDVIRGLRILYQSSNMAAGKLRDSVYVDRFGRGRLLPSFDPSATKKDDVQKLKQVMGNIIGLPFNEKKVDFPSYSIPDDLVHFFVFVTKEKLYDVQAFFN